MSSTRPAKPTLCLMIHAQKGKAYIPYLRKHVLAAAGLFPSPLRELSIALVGDGPMAALHEQFMNIVGPTDVLTFPMDTDTGGNVISGEIIICVPEARRQARHRHVEPAAEILLYAIHGILHLCGFDDRTEVAFRQMHRMENDILIRLGVGPVFGEVEPGEIRRKATGKPVRKSRPAAPKSTRPSRRRERLGV